MFHFAKMDGFIKPQSVHIGRFDQRNPWNNKHNKIVVFLNTDGLVTPSNSSKWL